MPTGLNPNQVVNRAINQIGDDQPPVTGTLPNFDTSPAGVAAAALYTSVVQTVLRTYGWDFSRNLATLVATGNAPPPQFAYEYAYPSMGIEIRQLQPTVLADANNPTPITWQVGNVTVLGVPTKVIWTNLQNALATISNQPPEGLWDAGFTESVVRLLASELAMAIAARPDTSQEMLKSAGDFERAAEGRDG
jgi:hypothetical protein